jgi:hypothetical protein
LLTHEYSLVLPDLGSSYLLTLSNTFASASQMGSWIVTVTFSSTL